MVRIPNLRDGLPIPNPERSGRDSGLRDEVRQELHIYQSRTGLSLGEIARRAGLSRNSLTQYSSSARFGSGNDGRPEASGFARALRRFMSEHPAPRRESPGRLYETAATGEMARLVDYCRGGGWGTLYGPAGAQKTFYLRYMAVPKSRTFGTGRDGDSGEEPDLVLVDVVERMSSRALLLGIAKGLGAPYAPWASGLRESILYTLRGRSPQSPEHLGRDSASVVIALDDAQLLYHELDTLEALRRLVDLSEGRVGLIVAGNEEIERLFEPRRGRYMEQWRSRVEQKAVRVLGPSPTEAAEIMRAELGRVSEPTLERCTVKDPRTKRDYVSARRLFNAIRDIRRERRPERSGFGVN